MEHSVKKITEIAETYLKKKKITYTRLHPPKFEEHKKMRDQQLLDIWVVGYDYTVFQEETAYIYINDTTGKVLYVLTKHGYIE